MRQFRKTIAALLPLASLVAGAAGAQPAQPDLAEFSGGMHALAETCGGYTAAELKSLREQQQAEAIARGGNAAQFKAAFDSAMQKEGQGHRCDPAERKKGLFTGRAVEAARAQMKKAR